MKSARAGAIFLVLFAMPFVGMGSAFMWKMLTMPDGSPQNLAGAVFGAGFVMIGLLIATGGVVGVARMKKLNDTKAANPTSPWLWREDWAQNRSYGEKRYIATTLWVITVLVSCLTIPWVFMCGNVRGSSAAPQIFIYGLASIAVILACAAVRATLRKQRFGKTFFEFDSLPFALGKKMSGRLNLRLDQIPQNGFEVRLSCVRRFTSGSGDQRTTQNETLWEEQQTISAAAVMAGPQGTSISVTFDIPVEAAESNSNSFNDRILWLLSAKAELPGVDFSEQYEVPIFRIGSSAAAASTPTFASLGSYSLRTTISSPGEKLEQPAKMSARISNGLNGTEIYLPALRNPGSTLALFAFAAVWSAVTYLLWKQSKWFFLSLFGFTDLLVLYGLVSALFSTARIQLTGDSVLLTKSTLGVGSTRRIPFSEIGSVAIVSGGQSSAGTAWHSLRLVRKDGKKLTLATGISNRQEARWLVSQMENLIGLKQDTRVQFEDFAPVSR